MIMKTLGRSGLAVSPLCVGAWSFGGGADSYWGKQEQADVDTLVACALDLGVNFFDTAVGYNDGDSERSLGAALRGKRDKAVICNKMSLQDDAAAVEKAVCDSLKKLETDYMDIMMIHWPGPDGEKIRLNLSALAKMVEKGYLRYIGVSNFSIKTLDIAKELGVDIVADEIAYNLMMRTPENALLGRLASDGIGVTAYMPLMQGILSGKYASIYDMPRSRRRSIQYDSAKNPEIRHGGSGAEDEVMAILNELHRISKDSGYSCADLSIAWLTSKPGVSSVIAGCRTKEQVIDNAKSCSLTLDGSIIKALDEVSEPLKLKLGDNLDMWVLGENSRVW